MPEAESVISYPPAGADTGALSAHRAGRAESVVPVILYGRTVQVRLSPSALDAASALPVSLIVEMELYFSCLVRKAVRFRTADDGALDIECASINERLLLSFRPVTTEHCALTDAAAPPLETMPVKRPQAFLPRWLNIDFRRGEWRGEFGY